MAESGGDQPEGAQNQPGANENKSPAGQIEPVDPQVVNGPSEAGFHGASAEKPSAEAQNRPAAEDPNIAIAKWTAAVARYTLALVIIGALGAVISFATLYAIKGQLDEMRDEQRPWISIEPAEQRGIKWREGTLSIDVVFSIKNVGKSPARKIFFDAEILSDDNFEAPKSDEISAFAGKIKIHKLDATTGAFLFPTQAYVETKMLDLDPPKTGFKPLILYPIILACAEYQFTSGVPKKSCAVFPLYAKQDVIWDAFFPDFDLGVSRGHDVPAPDAKIGAAINTYAD